MPTQTHTYATLEVSPAAHAEILGKLQAAGYQDQIHEEDGQVLIDMHGIALVTSKKKKPSKKQCAVNKFVRKPKGPYRNDSPFRFYTNG